MSARLCHVLLLASLGCRGAPDTCALLSEARALAPATRPNLLVVVADDLGTEQLTSYVEAPDQPATPTISCLAEVGVTYRNAWAAPFCSPARAALVTGRHSRRYGLGTYINVGKDELELPLDAPSLPRQLGEAGYATALAGKWHLSSIDSEHGHRHPAQMGFQHHAGSLGNLSHGLIGNGRAYDYEHWEKTTDGLVSLTRTYPTTDTVDEALGYVATQPSPWFVEVAFNAPHQPYHVPPRSLTSRKVDEESPDREKFRAAIEALDTELGRLLSDLGPEVLAETTVVFMSDNGSPGGVIGPPFSPERGKGTLYEGGVRVPLIVAGAGVADPGRVEPGLVHAVDLMPTLLELASLDPEGSVDGVSFAASLADPERSTPRDVLYADVFSPNGPTVEAPARAVRDDRFKLVRHASGDELFDVGVALDDGADLLGGPLDAEAEAAYQRLSEELAAMDARLDP